MKSRGSDERLERIEWSGPYILRDGITITMDEMARAADMNVTRSLTGSFGSQLMRIINESTIKLFLAPVPK